MDKCVESLAIILQQSMCLYYLVINSVQRFIIGSQIR